VPEAEPAVSALRLVHDPSAKDGAPAHVTLIFPFRPSEEIDDECLARLRRLFGSFEPFSLTIREIGRFPDTLWLAPESAEPVRRLTEALTREFPECPPYGGAFTDIVSHLTVAYGDEPTLAKVEEILAGTLRTPIEAQIEACSLLGLSPDGWREIGRFALKGSPRPTPP